MTRRVRGGAAALVAALALAGCVGQKLPHGHPHYVVGDPYQVGGEWFYPRIFSDYDVTGLSTLATGRVGDLTADGEAYDPDALAAASPVLPLPSIVRITDLVTGRTLEVRVNDRGPPEIGRVIAVTPRVARMLGFPDNGVVEVRVQLIAGRTAAIQQTLGAGPQVKAAPVAAITATSLAPPGSGAAAGGTTGGTTGATQTLGPQSGPSLAADTGTLSGRIGQAQPAPGPLWIQMGGFGQPRDAERTEQLLGGMQPEIVPLPGDDRVLYALRVGPYRSVAAADAALRDVLSRGVTDPAIIVR